MELACIVVHHVQLNRASEKHSSVMCFSPVYSPKSPAGRSSIRQTNCKHSPVAFSLARWSHWPDLPPDWHRAAMQPSASEPPATWWQSPHCGGPHAVTPVLSVTSFTVCTYNYLLRARTDFVKHPIVGPAGDKSTTFNWGAALFNKALCFLYASLLKAA